MNKKQLDFAVFCVENVAEKLNLNGAEVYEMFATKSNILDEYIIEHFDILHTQGKDYIVSDLIELITKARFFQETVLEFGRKLSPFKENSKMTANHTLLQSKYASVIAELSASQKISLRKAMDTFFKSQTYQEMREGIADMHCRSDKYLVEEIGLEGGASSE